MTSTIVMKSECKHLWVFDTKLEKRNLDVVGGLSSYEEAAVYHCSKCSAIKKVEV